MGANRFNRQMAELLPDSAQVTKSADATLTIYEQMVEINTTSASVEIQMPPVAEAKGLTFVLFVKEYTNAATVVAALSEDFTAPTFNGVDDGAILYSDGKRWWLLSERT